MGTSKDVDVLVGKAVAQGWRYKRGRKHGKLLGPGGALIVFSHTPSDHRGLLDLRSRLRRAGLDV